MTVKFGIKIGAMLSSLVLGLVCFVGCNSDDPATPPPGAGAASRLIASQSPRHRSPTTRSERKGHPRADSILVSGAHPRADLVHETISSA